MTSLQQTAMLGGAASAKTASYTLVAADAGTAISMSNAGATTITVNTALFAAGDTVHITNLGAGVCTITAGTATVNSSASLALAQYESGFLDFTSTSAAIFVKGAGAAAASGGMTLISTTTLSGATTTLSSIPQTYKTLYLVITGVTGNTANSKVRCIPNNSNLSDYVGATFDNTAGAASAFGRDGSRIELVNTAGSDRTDANNAWSLELNNYTSSTTFKPLQYYGFYVNASGGISNVSVSAAGAFRSNTAITSLVFDYGGTNTFASGTVLLYGVS
jgi:hypothetical protein